MPGHRSPTLAAVALLTALGVGPVLGGCTVVSVGSAVVGTAVAVGGAAVSVGTSVVGGTVKVAGKAVGATVDAVTPSSPPAPTPPAK